MLQAHQCHWAIPTGSPHDQLPKPASSSTSFTHNRSMKYCLCGPPSPKSHKAFSHCMSSQSPRLLTSPQTYKPLSEQGRCSPRQTDRQLLYRGSHAKQTSSHRQQVNKGQSPVLITRTPGCTLMPLPSYKKPSGKKKKVCWLVLVCCVVSETRCHLWVSVVYQGRELLGCARSLCPKAVLEPSQLFRTLPVGVLL